MEEYVFPAELGGCADRLYALRTERLKQKKVVEALEAEESALRNHIINELPKSAAIGIAGRVARVTVNVKDVPQVVDWPLLYAHVLATGGFELLQRRVNDSAVREQWDNGAVVPGVGVFQVATVSLTRV